MSTPESAIALITTCARLTRLVRHRSEGASTSAEWRALAIFDEHGPLRVGTFADLDGLSQPSATAMLRRLAEEGILERRPDPGDGRATVLALTPRGRADLARRRAAGAAAVTPLLERLSDAERAVLAEATAIMTRLLDEHPTPERTPQ